MSPQAQAVLAIGALFEADPYPALDDFEGWRRRVADRDASMLMMIGARASNVEADTQELDVDGVRVYVITPDGIADDDPRVFLEIHGGGLIQGGGECCRVMALRAMGWSQVPTWAVDYRMPPDHPYPTPLDDCLAVYRAILRDHRPEEVIVGGGSAGGNLAAAMMLRARDEGLPLPAAAVLLTPEVDLTESGDSFQTNLGLDNVLTESLMPANLLYAAGHDLTDPYVSPLFGDFTKGFPPTILASGTRDLFLSNTVRMHRALRAAGVDADLHIIEAGGHGGFFGQAPEDEHLAKEIRRFIDARWPRERLNDAPYAFE